MDRGPWQWWRPSESAPQAPLPAKQNFVLYWQGQSESLTRVEMAPLPDYWRARQALAAQLGQLEGAPPGAAVPEFLTSTVLPDQRHVYWYWIHGDGHAGLVTTTSFGAPNGGDTDAALLKRHLTATTISVLSSGQELESEPQVELRRSNSSGSNSTWLVAKRARQPK